MWFGSASSGKDLYIYIYCGHSQFTVNDNEQNTALTQYLNKNNLITSSIVVNFVLIGYDWSPICCCFGIYFSSWLPVWCSILISNDIHTTSYHDTKNKVLHIHFIHLVGCFWRQIAPVDQDWERFVKAGEREREGILATENHQQSWRSFHLLTLTHTSTSGTSFSRTLCWDLVDFSDAAAAVMQAGAHNPAHHPSHAHHASKIQMHGRSPTQMPHFVQ